MSVSPLPADAPAASPHAIVPAGLIKDLKAIVHAPPVRNAGGGFEPGPWSLCNPTCYDITKGKRKMLHYLTWADGGSTISVVCWIIFWIFKVDLKAAVKVPRFQGSPLGDPGEALLQLGLVLTIFSWCMTLLLVILKKFKKRLYGNYVWIALRLMQVVPILIELVYVCAQINLVTTSGGMCSGSTSNTTEINTTQMSTITSNSTEEKKEVEGSPEFCTEYLRPFIIECSYLPIFTLLHLWCAWIMASFCYYCVQKRKEIIMPTLGAEHPPGHPDADHPPAHSHRDSHSHPPDHSRRDSHRDSHSHPPANSHRNSHSQPPAHSHRDSHPHPPAHA